MATKHLIEAGHTRIGLVTVNPEPPPARQRRLGYEQALEGVGLPVDRALITASDRQPYGFVEEAGYEAMRILLRRRPRPTAVFAVSDMQALGCMRAAQEAGLSVPDDLAVVGFDDVQVCRYVGLSTLRQPVYEMGKLAIEKFLMRMQHPEHPVSHTVFAPRLVVRASSDASACDAPHSLTHDGVETS